MNTVNSNGKHAMLLMGGTFDPIHLGHINTAKETALWLNISKVTLIPAHIPPHKTGTYACATHRANMVELVCQEDPLFSLDQRELKRHSASYTIDTLQELRRENPKTQIFFIMGMDSLLSFTKWHQWRDILKLCNIVVNIRPGYSVSELKAEIPKELTGFFTDNIIAFKHAPANTMILHHCKEMDISSTEIRTNLKKLAIQKQCYQSYLLPSISAYIAKHKLYQ